MRPNPKRLNPLQLRTLALLQGLARHRAFASPPEPDGTVAIHTLPHAHSDHFHVGPAVVSVRDATGLGNPNVLNALARKGLLVAGRNGLPVLTAEGLAYHTGIAAERRGKMDPRWYHRARTAMRHKRQQIDALAAHMQTLPPDRKVGFKDCLIEVLRDEFDDVAWQVALDRAHALHDRRAGA